MLKKLFGIFATGFILTIAGAIGIGILLLSGLVKDEAFKSKIRETVNIAENTVESHTTVLASENIPQEDFDDVKSFDDDINNISKINISMRSGYIYLYSGEGCEVSSVGINPSDLKVDITDGTLNVRYDPTANISDMFDEKRVFITVPERIYEKTDIDMTAGELIVTDIMTDDLKFKISSGNAYFENITANNSAGLEMSAGESCFSGDISNADIYISSGNLVFNGVALNGDNNIKVSSGSAVLDITGRRSDYMISTHRSSGIVSINGTTVSKEYTDTDENTAGNQGFGKINADVSSGECVITFTAPEYYEDTDGDTEELITEYIEYSYQE